MEVYSRLMGMRIGTSKNWGVIVRLWTCNKVNMEEECGKLVNSGRKKMRKNGWRLRKQSLKRLMKCVACRR